MAWTVAPLHLWDVLGFGGTGLWVGVVGLGRGGVCGTFVVEHYLIFGTLLVPWSSRWRYIACRC